MSAAPTRPDAIASVLRTSILDGTYAAGDRLPAERDLAARLGANRASVREALRKLEQLGLLHIRRGGGATVRPVEEASLDVVRHLLFARGELDHDVLGQLFDVYEMVMAGAARLALEHGSAAQLDHARYLLGRLGDPATGADASLDLVEELIDLIARASGNLVLRLCRNALDPVFGERYRDLRRGLRPPRGLLRRSADALDRAIAARDPVAVEEATRRLLRSNRERLLVGVEALRSRWHADDGEIPDISTRAADGSA